MKTLTHLELVEKLQGVSSTFVGLETLTDARARKNPFGRIFKKTRLVASIGGEYQRSVNREAERQDGKPQFKAESLPYGQWSAKNKVIEHNGEFQLRVLATPGKRMRQPAKVQFYDCAGNLLDFNSIKPFLSPARESIKQQVTTGINKTVWVRNYAFKSIKRIRINGTTYNLIKA